MRRAAAAVVLLAAFSASVAFGQTSSHEDFEEWCRTEPGRWIINFTLSADRAGLGKKGETGTAYGDIRLVADGNAILGTYYGGNTTTTRLTTYNAVAKQIVVLEANSAGTMWNCIYSKEDGKWKIRAIGSTPDGRKRENNATLTISDDGDTHTWTGTRAIDDGELLPLKTVFRRVSK